MILLNRLANPLSNPETGSSSRMIFELLARVKMVVVNMVFMPKESAQIRC
ncbi:hypothetical protein CEB3_c08860 [Peptococcaceae bacterium CEB3]|nr:hypothetical protein CEB3_c08860 [Peptococcaceae bacterium CEB3]